MRYLDALHNALMSLFIGLLGAQAVVVETVQKRSLTAYQIVTILRRAFTSVCTGEGDFSLLLYKWIKALKVELAEQ